MFVAFSKRKLSICCVASLLESFILLITCSISQCICLASLLKILDRNNNSTVTGYCFYLFGLPFTSLSYSQCTLVRRIISECQYVTLKTFTSLKMGLKVYRRGIICMLLFPSIVFFQITHLSCLYLLEAI